VLITQNLGRLALAAVACAAVLSAGLGQARDDAASRPIALLAAIEGPIGPAATRHVEKVVEEAAARRAEVLILRLNTPGGLADAMREIISEILTSPVPVVGYVAPPGAHASSAGTYILYATHIAAMAPGTNLGAATPIPIGGLPGAPPAGEKRPKNAAEDGDDKDANGDDPGLSERLRSLAPSEAMNAKATNDAVAFIRSLAEMHGRNADWAEKAVREAASLSSARALQEGVIDLVAEDVAELLEAIDGRTVSLAGEERVLATAGLSVETVEMDPITRLLAVISNPNVALILMMIGIYGIIFEFWNPGSIGPGMVGAICLTLGLYALNQLPLDYAGLALVGLGVAFMVAESFTPTFGVFGISGLVAFVIGATMLVETDVPEYQISWWVIGVMAALSAAMLVLVLGYTLRAYRRPAVSGPARMVGAEVPVLDWSGREGHVWAESERWQARSDRELTAGTTARVRAVDGLILVVDPAAGTGRENGEGGL